MFASLFFTFPKRTKNNEKLYMDKAFKHTKEVGIVDDDAKAHGQPS